MIFKEEKLQAELHSRHTLLQQMAADFESLSRSFGIEPVVTRILERIVGSSGVHEDGRGIDFKTLCSVDHDLRLPDAFLEFV